MANPCGQMHLFMHKSTKSGSEIALIPVLCKSWTCPVCRPKKAEQVRHFIRKHFADQDLWMLTFTFFHRGTALNAWKSIGKKLNRMLSYARKYNGKFDYVRVVEPHKDGSWPHFHMLVTKNIASTRFVKLITNWGFGWNFHCKRMSAEQGANLMSKYLTKEWPTGDADLLRQFTKTRIVSCSRSLGAIFTNKPTWKLVKLSNPFSQIPYLRNAVFNELFKRKAGIIDVTPLPGGFYIVSDATLSPGFTAALSDRFEWDLCDDLHVAKLSPKRIQEWPF